MSSLGGPDVDKVDVEAILDTVRKSVATAVANQMEQLTKEMTSRLDTTIHEVKQLSCKFQSVTDSKGIGSGSFRSAARSDPGRSLGTKSPFTQAKRHASKNKGKKRGEQAQTLYQLNELLFDEILRSKQLTQKYSEDRQEDGETSQHNSAPRSMQTCRNDEAGELPSTSGSPTDHPQSTLAEKKPGAAQDNRENDPERSVGLPMTLQEEQEVAVAIPGAPEPPPPLMPVMPSEPGLEVAGHEAGTSKESIGAHCRQSKPTSRVRMEGAEAIVCRAIDSFQGEAIEEENNSLVPFANYYFTKAHLLRATLLFSFFAGLCVRLPIQVASWPHIHFLRECSLTLYAATAFVGSYMMNDASAVAHKMMKWASAHCISENWWRVALVCRRRCCQCWVLMLACALLTEVLIVHPEGLKNIDLQTQAMMILFVVGEVFSLFAFVVASYLLACTVFLHVHLLIGLDLFIDKWCGDLLDDADFELGVSSWNTVQAFIRRVGNAIDNSLSGVLMGAFLGCGTVAVRAISFGMQPGSHWGIVIEACSGLPLLWLVLLAGILLLQCSGISEKCAVLPSLINQISSSDEIFTMDQERHYLVCYLANSAAGIYVKGVKLTMRIVVKTAHSFGVALFAVLGLAVRMSV